MNPIGAALWHPTRNGDLTPHDVVAGSHKKAWFEVDGVAVERSIQYMDPEKRKAMYKATRKRQSLKKAAALATAADDSDEGNRDGSEAQGMGGSH